MGKFRSKLKGKSKGKRWQKGQSSNSNPKIQKYRDMAKSRFFQENLGSTGLTQQAVSKHDAMMTYGHASLKKKSDAENELLIAKELENMSMKSGDEGSETEYSESFKSGTYKTFQTFASDWSQCSNVSFSKLLTRFDSNNGLHKEMLAVLAAVTEVIKEQGGKESTTEYFAALMETLKTSELEENAVAALTLVSMGIKNVPPAVLRKYFSMSAKIFVDILEKDELVQNGTMLRSAIGCLSVLLRAQEYALWGDSSTMRVFESLLAFALHSKPKVRKAAQHAVTSVLRGSCFMIPSDDQKVKVPKLHPGSNRVAEFCLSQIKAEALLAGHRIVLHTLTMLRDVLPVFSKDYIKSICEAILSLMTHNNVYIKTCCLHTLHALFSSSKDTSNMTASLAVQLTRALMAARPPANDTGQVLAWAAVLQQGYCCLANLDLNLCMPNLPAFVNICVSELWLSDVADINSASTNALKAIILDCVKLALDSDETFIKHKSHVEAIFKSIGTGLDNPFNQAIRHVVMTIAVCFEIGNEKVANSLGPLLRKLNDRRESHNFDNDKEVEYATGCAIKSLGPEFVLRIIPLRDGPENINLERSWLLPVLKEKITNSNLKFFATEILEMATFCRKRSRELTQMKDVPGSHTYELLCNQFWALLPSFCNSPKDIKDSFKSIARVLGSVLKDNPEFRLSVMQALRKLITCSADNEEDKLELGRFAKNYLPILLNVYMSPAKGSYAEGHRLAALETIQVYLTISDQTLREELFTNALQQLETSKENHFQREAILDIIRTLVLYQTSERIAKLFDEWVYPLCETVLEDPKKHKKAKKENQMDTENGEGEKKSELKYKEKSKLLEMEHKKAYRILEEIFKSDKESCKEFLKENYKKIKKLLMSSLNKVADSSKAARLRCIEHLINTTPFLNAESKLLKSAIAESVICTKDINSKCRQCAFNLINSVGTVLKSQEGGMQAFVNMLTSGLSAPLPRIVSATLRAIASALFNFSEDMGLETVQGLLETVVEHMTNNNREIVAACMSFLKVYTKVLPTDVLAGSLPVIFKSLSTMPEDCKRHSRLEIGYFLTKMMRKFGADTVEKLIPPTDEVMLRRLRNIRKMDNRKKRQKENQNDQSDDSDTDMPIKGTSKTLEDILKDSDSEMEFLDEEDDKPRPKVKKMTKAKGKNQAWIEDDPDNIVDLADVSASRKITATDPSRKQKASEVKAQKKKDGGFKTAPDGRLIITDDAFENDDDDNDTPRPSGDIDTDTDDTDAEEEDSKPSKLLKPGAKRRYDDILSLKSGKSSRSRASTVTVGSKYKAGGKGIHRPLGSAASVASGAGSEYRAKKAKGDVKKQGKHDPYAYLPLSRKNLNKRKKAQTSKQFKGVVKSKTKLGKNKKK
ncbi:RRP12-like protein isoform X1 [Spodoptera litura]|uniref:RRP12-like protein isoform X1 n=2 Tax=Spodoptera litura TaxID=69820 RepID=A0A9J7IZU8_SPOLT|nr:RRP12-like protein isoform X1 [Spodoptera litura]